MVADHRQDRIGRQEPADGRRSPAAAPSRVVATDPQKSSGTTSSHAFHVTLQKKIDPPPDRASIVRARPRRGEALRPRQSFVTSL